LGFERAATAATGRPAYSPATLLKIYVYGDLNSVQSSRRLETEAQRNLELIWLTGRLAPDFKTIADFRRDKGEAIRKVCKETVLLCRRMKLFTDGIVAIDGSKFKAVNNRDKNVTDRKLAARIEQLEDSIKRYLVELDRGDRDAAAVLPGRVAHLKDKLIKVKQQIQALNEIGEQMKASEDGQISLTDPDARWPYLLRALALHLRSVTTSSSATPGRPVAASSARVSTRPRPIAETRYRDLASC